MGLINELGLCFGFLEEAKMRDFEISDEALAMMRRIISEEASSGAEVSTVRLYVNGMGVSGLTWGLCFDDCVEGDVSRDFGDFTVLVEGGLLDALGGIKVEYEDNIWGGGFNVIPQDSSVDFGGGCDGCCEHCSGCG